ncbi:hypothetical protein TNCV_36251 [Trichonephila clavipes]|nr:hypothetical protein TNCV_36251 [Trichonephila clavipes]
MVFSDACRATPNQRNTVNSTIRKDARFSHISLAARAELCSICREVRVSASYLRHCCPRYVLHQSKLQIITVVVKCELASICLKSHTCLVGIGDPEIMPQSLPRQYLARAHSRSYHHLWGCSAALYDDMVHFNNPRRKTTPHQKR